MSVNCNLMEIGNNEEDLIIVNRTNNYNENATKNFIRLASKLFTLQKKIQWAYIILCWNLMQAEDKIKLISPNVFKTMHYLIFVLNPLQVFSIVI